MRQVYLNAKNEYILMLEVTLGQILLYASPENRGHHKQRLLGIYKKIEFVNNKLYGQRSIEGRTLRLVQE